MIPECNDGEEIPTNLVIPPRLNIDTDIKDKPKSGEFETQSFTLKKRKRQRRYGCKLCTEILDSAHQLTFHHQDKHGILYCDVYNKAFNNPTKYQNRELKYQCACGASFTFSSQLRTHSVVHRRHASHHWVYPNCQRLFKNKGDLKRHAAEHYRQPHECPNCDYKNNDIRNLESHHLKHSNISKYTCENCGKNFKYNTQYRHHLKNLKNCIVPKRSESPEF